jgi:predicted nucleic acid-binding protein
VRPVVDTNVLISALLAGTLIKVRDFLVLHRRMP